ncbi:putative lipoate--protein ligase [Rhodotorula paludigena]|uniref:putative lipoate--protein ligase n=1 Tax=Rhodotorula paludigena TaxID=86838 RepID=UPI00316D7AF0
MLALRSAQTSHRAPSIHVSESHNPWFNLAYEDWLFRKTEPDHRILYLYRNCPSVIIGRNQNPWKEIDLHRLRELGIPFVRRKSGGGTVYHDLGNTNYCVFVPREEFDRRSNAELVTAGLNELDVPAFVNERHDIVVDGFKMSFRSFLDGLDFLGTLRGVLGSKKEAMVTKGVASVPSPVRNLREWSTRVNHERFVEVVARQFEEKYALSGEIKRIDEGVLEHNEYVREVVDELKSWEWQYGQTPEFTHELSGTFPFGSLTLSVNSKHGLITSASLSNPPRPLDWWRTASELCRLLEGDRYETLERTREALPRLKGEERERMETLVEWLQREM